jgi:hypothetical protein
MVIRTSISSSASAVPSDQLASGSRAVDPMGTHVACYGIATFAAWVAVPSKLITSCGDEATARRATCFAIDSLALVGVGERWKPELSASVALGVLPRFRGRLS